MKQRVLTIAFIISLGGSMQLFGRACNGYAELCDVPYNRETKVEMHNISRATSIVNNQNLTVPQGLTVGVRAFKVPLHYEEDYGLGKGKNPMVCHGIYRPTFYGPYFDKVFGSIEGLLSKLTENKILGELVKPILDLITTYKSNLQGVADMERQARIKTYGSSTQAAVLPYTACVIDPSAQPFARVLADIKNFLVANPNEIVTLKVENVIESWDVIANEFKAVGLDKYAHAQDKTKPWPTLGEMIDAGKRFVIIIKRGGPNAQYPWMNYEGDFDWGSKYHYEKKNELLRDSYLPTSDSNYKNRFSGPKNKTFTLSHFITFGFAGSAPLAAEVNTSDVLTKRVQNIAVPSGQQPTFISLDFVEQPNKDAFDFVNHLNGVGKYKGSPLFTFQK